VFTPRVGILEYEHELTLHADVPGVELEGADIHFENGVLTVHLPKSDAIKPRRIQVTAG
jgi:HSP20 family molecular chaperone IbpA